MNWIVIAALDEQPWPVIYMSPVKPEACEEIANYISRCRSRLEGDEPKGPVKVLGAAIIPADGYPYTISSRFFTGATIPILVADDEEERPRSIGFAAA